MPQRRSRPSPQGGRHLAPGPASSLSVDDDDLAGAVPVGHRGQLPAPGDDREGARAEVPSVVRGTIGFWDGTTLVTWTANVQAAAPTTPCPTRSLDVDARHVRHERQDGDRGDLQARVRPRRQILRPRSRDHLLRPRRLRRAGPGGVSLPARRDGRRSGAPIHVHRVPEPAQERQRAAGAACRPRTPTSSTTTTDRGPGTGRSGRNPWLPSPTPSFHFAGPTS